MWAWQAHVYTFPASTSLSPPPAHHTLYISYIIVCILCRKRLILWPKPQRKTRQRIMRKHCAFTSMLWNISCMPSNVSTAAWQFVELHYNLVTGTNISVFLSHCSYQMRPTATRQRRVYEPSVCSTWTERRNLRITWRIKTNRARSLWRRHRAMTSM